MSILRPVCIVAIPIVITSLIGCEIINNQREDCAWKVGVSESGSIQNPAWSPDGTEILFTRFRSGYNEGPADLLIINLDTTSIKTLVSDGSGNINLPGSSWNPISHKIVFASTRDPHDEIYIIGDNGKTGDEIRVTDRSSEVAYEPSFSPDGQWVVFESHQLDVEGYGVITKYKIDGSQTYQPLTDETDDCRQPNWSPAGNRILYQKFFEDQWDIWVMNIDGSGKKRVTSGNGDKTDASFSPDGKWIVYSSDEGDLKFANLFIIPVSGGESIRITQYKNGYDGAPSWSTDGTKIAFESFQGDPDEFEGKSLWIIDVPKD